jgi:hypothetical protein
MDAFLCLIQIVLFDQYFSQGHKMVLARCKFVSNYASKISGRDQFSGACLVAIQHLQYTVTSLERGELFKISFIFLRGDLFVYLK